MTIGASEEVTRTIEAFKAAIAQGSEGKTAVADLAGRLNVSRGVIRSRLRRHGLWGQPDFEKGMGRRSAGLHDPDYKADRLVPLNPPVYRDPCPRCGVRRDIGCEHRPCRLGMVL